MVHTTHLKLKDFSKAHFIGIGGIGMSGLARLFLHEGKTVSGSDRAPSAITEALKQEGVTVFNEQVAGNISAHYDLIVYTEAMSPDHEEMVAAKALGVPMVNYFTALGMVANEYYLIAVSGSHGKTTTTAMLIDIFEAAGLDPSAIVGSLRAKSQSNYRAGKSKYFIVEACEYKRDFLSLKPDILVITNLEHEHVDYYKDLASVQAAFHELALVVPEDGYVIANLGEVSIQPVVTGLRATVIDYSKYFNPLRLLTMPGVHNQMNAAAAVAAATLVGITTTAADAALAQFGGTWRRFEYKGEVHGAKVYDDYGHHPTEIKATILGARELYPDRQIKLIYQPHMYSRTKDLWDDFVTVLGSADQVILLPIYAAREEPIAGITHTALATAVGDRATALDEFGAAAACAQKDASSTDVILVMGAGDVTKIATKLVK